MYAKFFGLQQEPFSIAPDPRYLFMSERHRDALAHLLYGVRGGGGFVLLTGEIGAGKTTVCRCFLEQIPKRCNVAYIFNPKLTVTELLKTVCEEYHIVHEHPAGSPETVKQYVDPLNEFLLRTHAVGQNNLLIIDEAQNLSAEVLEQLRLLTNLETSERKLLQIILIGQPELRTMLAQPELEQLAQRVVARFHLQALSEAETAQYVRHRLGVAGFSGAMPFDRAALRRLHRLSRGVPRRINLLCDRALLGAYAQGRATVDRATLEQAAGEVFDKGELPASARERYRRWVVGVGGVAVGVCAAAAVFVAAPRSDRPANLPVVAAVAPASAASAVVQAASAAILPASASASAVAAIDPAAGITVALRSERDAWLELAAAWPLKLPEGEPCQALKRQQVQCFRSEDGLALLRLLDRPAILTLRDNAGKPSYVTVMSLGAQQVSVRAGGSTQTVSLLALSKQWRGEFAVLWRVPPGYQPKLISGPTADWLVAQLAKVFGESPVSTPDNSDDRLQAKIAAFQRSQGLRGDGLAGPITLMQLNRAAGVDEPRLPTDPSTVTAAAR